MPYTHLERLSACSVFCSRGHTATDTGVRHQVPSHNWSPSGIRLIFGRSSARRPYLQMPQWHPRVAKRASIGTLARGPSTEALLGQGRVSKERKSVPLTGLWSGSRPGLARPPCLQMPQWHPHVAKRSSDQSSARSPCLQRSQWHPGVAKGLL